MGYDDRREILERLEALERRMGGSRHDDRGDRDRGGHCDHDHHGHDRRHRDRHDGGRRGDRDFDEKRIIDTIVRLVAEHVECIIEDKMERSGSHGNSDGGGEKRIVDLIVGLVSEHVQEIVATELDRRLGPAGDPPADSSESSRD